MKNLFNSLPARLLLGVLIGIIIGLMAGEGLMTLVVTLKYICGQIIFFTIPLIIIAFISPSITAMSQNASRFLILAVILAYTSSVAAAVISAVAGYSLIPMLDIVSSVDALKKVPGVLFKLDIPAVMSVMSALAFSILMGLTAAWTKAEIFTKMLIDFQKMILALVSRIVIPILPFFIATTFCVLSYEGSLTEQLPVFLSVICIVLVGHVLWLGVLYGLGGAYSGKNPWEVLKHYGPAYLTAVGTMSSAATLPVSLSCAQKSSVLRKDLTNFGIPLFANIHLCGSVLTEVFFVMAVSQILYGKLPEPGTMGLFIVLLGIFAIGAPGVPGGTVMASLGLITGILAFDETGTALMLTIFALQDSFGTACNVTGDGALTLMLSGYAEKHNL